MLPCRLDDALCRNPLYKVNARNRGRTVTGVWFECSWGGAGMMVRVPSNRSITPASPNGSTLRIAPTAKDVEVAQMTHRTQIPYTGNPFRENHEP